MNRQPLPRVAIIGLPQLLDSALRTVLASRCRRAGLEAEDGAGVSRLLRHASDWVRP